MRNHAVLDDIRSGIGEIGGRLDHLIARVERFSSLEDELAALRDELGTLRSGRDIARQIAEAVAFKGDDANGLYRAFVGSEEPINPVPQPVGFTSSLCHQAHFGFDQYRFWTKALKWRPVFYRKQWEFVYIAQVLFERGMLARGRRGIVFGAGKEPLPALFASFGAEILATDQPTEAAAASGWTKTDQFAYDLSALNQRGICTESMFRELVSFRSVNMTDIPTSLDCQFDFCWSACALEHLGSLQNGLDFIEDSMRVLNPGGVAVHATEFNLSSNDDTVESNDLSIYRRRDIEAFLEHMTNRGFIVSPIDWKLGEGFAETVVDLPPFGRGEPHIRLKSNGYDTTSIGLILEKPWGRVA